MAENIENTSPNTSNLRITGDQWEFTFTKKDLGKTDSQAKEFLRRMLYLQCDNIHLQSGATAEDLKEYLKQGGVTGGNTNTTARLNQLLGVLVDQEYENLFIYLINKSLDIPKSDDNKEELSPVHIIVGNDNSKSPQKAGDPIYLFNGNFVYNSIDIQIDGAGLDFVFERTYSQLAIYNGPLGYKWDHSCNLWLRISDDGKIIHRSTGALNEEIFKKNDRQNYWIPPDGTTGVILEKSGILLLKLPDGRTVFYQPHPTLAPKIHIVDRIEDRFGNYLQFNYEDGLLNNVLVNHLNRKVTFQYDSGDKITSIRDFSGRVWRYDYDDFSDLIAVSTPATPKYKNGLTTCYEYTSASVNDFDLQHNLTSIIDAAGQIYLENEYGLEVGLLNYNRVVRQRQGGGETLFEYQDVIEDFNFPYEAHECPAYQTVVTARNGQQIRYLFNYYGNVIFKEEYARFNGTLQLIGWHYRYNKDGNLVGMVSPQGVITQHLYGREYYERNIQIDENYTPTEDENLVIASRQSFHKVLATITRGNYYDIYSLNRSVGLWKDISLDIYFAVDADIIQKLTYEPDFGQLLSVSDVRYTRSADPNFQEDSSYLNHLTRYNYKPNQNSLFHVLQSVQSPRLTLANGVVSTSAYITIDQVDERGRIERITGSEGLTIQNIYYDGNAGVLEGFLKQTVADPDGLNISTAVDRDSLGRVVKTYLPKFFEFNDERFILEAKYNELGQIVSYTSTLPFNITNYLEYNRLGNVNKSVLQLKNPDGTLQSDPELITTYKYDEDFHLIETTVGGKDLFARKKYHNLYDIAGRLYFTISPGNKKSKFYFNERSLPSKNVTDFGGVASFTKNSFDFDGRLVAHTDPNDCVFKFNYDAPGRIIESEDPFGNKSLMAYDKAGNLICARFFEKKNENRFLLLMRVAFFYDELGRKVKESINKFEDPIEITSTLSDAFLLEGPNTELTFLHFYNKNSQLIKTIGPNGQTYSNDFDKFGRLVKKIDPYGNEVSFKYDKASNIIRSDRLEVIRDGRTNTITGDRHFATSYAYDELNRIIEKTNTLGSKTKYTYDSRSLVTKIINPLGNEIDRKHDVFGRCLSLTQYLKNNDENIPASIEFNYNLDDLVTKQIDAQGKVTAFKYDTMNRMIGTILPDFSEDIITYNKASQVISYKDRNALVKQFEYDYLGRLITLKLTASGIHRDAVEGSQFSNYLYDGIGRLLSAENEYAKSSFKYNSLGLLTEESSSYKAVNDETSTQSFTTKRRYSDSAAVKQIDYPSGRILTYQRDMLDRITSIKQTSKGNDYPGDMDVPDDYEIVNIEYLGLQRKKTFRPNQTSTEYCYDAGGRTTEIKHLYNEGLLMRMQFLYDAVGNLRKKNEQSAETNKALDYSYDSLNRLIGVTKANLGALFNPADIQASTSALPDIIPDVQSLINNLFVKDDLINQKYKYDIVGNRMPMENNSATNNSATIEDYQPNDLDQYQVINNEWLNYDNNGNLIRWGNIFFKYNFRNQLSSITNNVSGEKIQFYHDQFGRKIKEIKANQNYSFVYNAFNIIEEHNNGKLVSSNILDAGIDNHLQSSASGVEFSYYADLIKSTRQILKGENKDRFYNFDEFGNQSNDELPNDFNTVRFTGKRLIAEAEAYDFVYRTYLPAIGRFMQRDPKGYVDGTNLYAFVNNNPLAATDPFGTESRPETAVNQGANTLKYLNNPVDANGNLLNGVYNLWSGDIGKADASAAAGWIMGQTPQHLKAKLNFVTELQNEANKLGLPFGGENDLFNYAKNKQIRLSNNVMDDIWGIPSREIARKAAISGMPVASYGLDKLPPGNKPEDTIQIKEEIPTVGVWGFFGGGLMKINGVMNLYNSANTNNLLIKFIGIVGGSAEILGGTLYMAGAATMTTKFMELGSGISKFIGGPTASILSAYAFYEDIENGNWSGALASGTGTASGIAFTLGSKAIGGPLAGLSFAWSFGWGFGKWADAKFNVSDILSDRAMRNKDIYEHDLGLSSTTAGSLAVIATFPVMSTVGEFLGDAAGWVYELF
jgi:RHS repeat-associated protein